MNAPQCYTTPSHVLMATVVGQENMELEEQRNQSILHSMYSRNQDRRHHPCFSFNKFLGFLCTLILTCLLSWTLVHVLPFHKVQHWIETTLFSTNEHPLEAFNATRWFKNQDEFDEKNSYDILSGSTIKSMIKSQWRMNDVNVVLADNAYHTIQLDDIKSFLSIDETDSLKYYNERMDCDDFAMILSGNLRQWEYHIKHTQYSFLFCIAYGTHRQYSEQGHAFNLMIGQVNNKDQHQIFLIEPQTDEIFLPETFAYLVNFVMC